MGNQERSTVRLNYLMERYRTNTCTRIELEELFQLLGESDGTGLLQNLQQQWAEASEMTQVKTPVWDLLFEAMMEQTHAVEPVIEPSPTRRRRSGRRRRWFLASLCFLLLLGGAGILIRLRSVPNPGVPRVLARTRRFNNDVQPG